MRQVVHLLKLERGDVTQENVINTNTLKGPSYNEFKTSACSVHKLLLSECKDSHMYIVYVCSTYPLLVETNFTYSHVRKIIFLSDNENYNKALKKREYKYFSPKDTILLEI